MPPKQKKAAAMILAVVGLGLTIAGPLIPGGERLVRDSPPHTGHVTELAGGGGTDADDRLSPPLLAGTSTGDIWRRHAGLWQRLALDFDGHPITAILGDPAIQPVGTAGGLYNPPPGVRFAGRVADVLQTPEGLIVGNDEGIHWLATKGAQPTNAGVNVYRFASQRIDGQTYLHAGTVGAGVHSTTPDAMRTDWPANNRGLPQSAYIYSFAVTQGGKLLAGTKSGIFWQIRPGTVWQPLPAGQRGTRALSLYRAPADAERRQRLWIGTDGYLLHTDLLETAEDLRVAAPAVAVRQPQGALPYGISGIRPSPRGVTISAGAVYQWGPARLPGWYWISIGGIALLLIAGWMLPAREPPSESAPDSTH